MYDWNCYLLDCCKDFIKENEGKIKVLCMQDVNSFDINYLYIYI